jgi:hypothetical protein
MLSAANIALISDRIARSTASGRKTMSTDGEPFKTGLARGMAGKTTAQSVVDVDHFFDTAADRAARQRGFEAGAAARATAEAIGALPESHGGSGGSSYSGSSHSGQGGSSNWPLVGMAIYALMVIGAFFLLKVVKTWSLVWWLCVLVIATGIPIYIALFYVGLWVIAGLVVLWLLLYAIQHFANNLY